MRIQYTYCGRSQSTLFHAHFDECFHSEGGLAGKMLALWIFGFCFKWDFIMFEMIES